MWVKVHGLKADGTYFWRVVTMGDLIRAWGPWARRVANATRDNPLVVGDSAVWSELVK